MKYCLPLLFLALASACSTVRPLPTTDSTKVEVRTETVIEKDTIFVELPRVVERLQSRTPFHIWRTSSHFQMLAFPAEC